ncbi:MAG: hypothetical protein M1419_07165 [Bacteroidetes bacterium]|nr:hypothetical protein [Bacteroidota bacterium]
MKKSVLFFLLSFSIISLLVISSCSEGGNEIPVNNSVDNEFSDMVFPNFNDIIWDEVSGGTIDEEFSIIPYYNNKSIVSNGKESSIQCGDDDSEEHNGDDDHHGDCDNDHHGCCYGTILHQLNLTKDQKNQIYQFKKEFHHCVHDARENYEDAKDAIIKNAHQLRKEIIHKWKNGDITKDEAKALLAQLKADTKQLIADLKATFKAAVGDCLCTFLKAIVSVLDDVQKETFITWVENNNCIDINCDLRGGANNQL